MSRWKVVFELKVDAGSEGEAGAAAMAKLCKWALLWPFLEEGPPFEWHAVLKPEALRERGGDEPR